jgi:hypothetical protein
MEDVQGAGERRSVQGVIAVQLPSGLYQVEAATGRG